VNINNISHIKELQTISHLKDEFVIMNSSILCLLGMKYNNKDIDLLVTKNFPSEISLNNVSINTFERWSHRLEKFSLDTESFIQNHSFYFCGYNFCKIEIFLEILKTRKKQNSGGDKVLKQIELIKSYLSESGTKHEFFYR
jgi:hypothetical protein